MTEAEWLACAAPEEMLVHLGESSSQRKLRLFVCACFRAGEPWDDRGRAISIQDLITLAEQLADGIASEQDLQIAWQKDRQARTPGRPRNHPSRTSLLLRDNVFSAAVSGSSVAAIEVGMKDEGADFLDAMEAEQTKHASLLRDIFGNPFRPVAFSPSWRTDTAVTLARQMYDLRDFGAMPILADALQDAGCDSEDILNHCRDASATHVRGCWVVDLVLGKA